jgi:hypothetical protein
MRHSHNYVADVKKEHRQSLRQKGYINIQDKLTLDGIAIMESFERVMRQKENVADRVDPEFQEWWDLYPQSDKHLFYPATRNLKTKRRACQEVYRKALQTYSHEDLMEALRKDIHQRKIRSTQRNELTFMKNSINYLMDEDYLMYLNTNYDQDIKPKDVQDNPRHKLL